VAFALEHPAHFSVMFDPHLLRMDDPALDAERSQAFENFFASVQQTTGAADAGQIGDEALAAWSVVHGVAVLWLQGNLPFPPDPTYVGPVFAQLAGAFLNIAVRSAPHLHRA
jgi:Tetracyclin repressor-like, C-terminal domain